MEEDEERSFMSNSASATTNLRQANRFHKVSRTPNVQRHKDVILHEKTFSCPSIDIHVTKGRTFNDITITRTDVEPRWDSYWTPRINNNNNNANRNYLQSHKNVTTLDITYNSDVENLDIVDSATPPISGSPVTISDRHYQKTISSPNITGHKAMSRSQTVDSKKRKIDAKSDKKTLKRSSGKKVIDIKKEEKGISCSQWFSDIVGCSEIKFKYSDRSNIYADNLGYFYIKNLQTNRITKAGKFTLQPLEELYNVVVNRTPPKKGSIINICLRKSLNDKESLPFVDVSCLQTHPKNKKAVFQIASNFNALECSSKETSPSDESFFSMYAFDKTQGPIASISGGGAAITRLYGAFYDPKLPVNDWAQTETNQIEMLENLSEYFTTHNGYIINSDGDRPLPTDDEEIHKLLLSYKVPYHRKLQVTTGRKLGSGHLARCDDSHQIIDQVFCSALSLDHRSQQTPLTDEIKAKAKFCLQCSYESTYLATIANGRKHLFLTLIGGGVFSNPLEWIYEAIFNAHRKWGSYIPTVTLCIFSAEYFYPGFIDLLEEHNLSYRFNVYNRGECISTTEGPQIS